MGTDFFAPTVCPASRFRVELARGLDLGLLCGTGGGASAVPGLRVLGGS